MAGKRVEILTLGELDLCLNPLLDVGIGVRPDGRDVMAFLEVNRPLDLRMK